MSSKGVGLRPCDKLGMVPLFFILSLISSHANAETPNNFRSGSILFSHNCDPKVPGAEAVQDVCACAPVKPPAVISHMDMLKQGFPDLRLDGTSSGPSRTPRKYLGQMYLSEPEAAAPSTSGQKNFLPAGDFTYLAVGDRVV